MSESGDYEPAPHWRGYDFSEAKAVYGTHVRKSYEAAVVKKVKATSLVPDEIVCDNEAFVVIVCDVTGSMGDWPQTIFSKLPYLEHETKEYLGEDTSICFMAIGDVNNDQYPLQVTKPVKGLGLKEALEQLIIEKGGGTGSEESYDLAALYLSRNVSFPKVIKKPICIFIGDEGVYSVLTEDVAKKVCKVKLAGKRIDKETIFSDLKDKFNTYIVRKPYGESPNIDVNSPNGRIQNQWCELLGGDHVISLPEAGRVVDVIFGILAKETGRIGYFEKELKDRQLSDKNGKQKVDVVLQSLHAVHKEPPPVENKKESPGVAKSVTRRPKSAGSLKSVSILDED